MGRAIGFQLYRIESRGDGSSFFVQQSYPELIDVNDIDFITPVNVQGGPDFPGLGWLYSKFTLKQSGMDQEFFVMNSVLDIKTQWNS